MKKKPEAAASFKDRYELWVETPLNGQLGRSEVFVMDLTTEETVYDTPVNLATDKERLALAGRIADKLGYDKAEWAAEIDAWWLKQVAQAGRFKVMAEAGFPEAAPGACVDGVTVVADDDGGRPPGRGGGGGGDGGPLTENLTDVGNGRRLARQHGSDLRHVHAWRKWLVWDEKRWCLDDTGEVVRRAKDVAGRLAEEDYEWAMKSEEGRHVNAMVDLARSEPGIPVRHTKLDCDPFLLNCVNGTLDLRTGKLREHRRGDLLTKLCPTVYDPDAECELWARTLTKIFGNKLDLVNFFQRLCGYSLTGDVREQVIPIFWGDGSNGKSLVFATVLAVMGPDYAGVAAREIITGNEHAHTTFLADLFGKRLVTSAETAEGGRLNEPLIKQLSAGTSRGGPVADARTSARRGRPGTPQEAKQAMTSNGNVEPPDQADVVADEVCELADTLSGELAGLPDAGLYVERLAALRDQLLDLLQEVRRPPPEPQGGPVRRTPPEKLAMARQMLQGGLSIRHVSRLTGMTRETVRSVVPEAAPQAPPPPNGKPQPWPPGPLDPPGANGPKKITREERAQAVAMARAGSPLVTIADQLGVTRDRAAQVVGKEEP
jgi:transposase-like protein